MPDIKFARPRAFLLLAFSAVLIGCAGWFFAPHPEFTGPAAVEIPAASPTDIASVSLCDRTEASYFEASVEGSVEHVSMCGSADLAGAGAWLQFRQGNPAAEPRLVHPVQREGSLERFEYGQLPRMGMFDVWIAFEIDGRDYHLYEAVIVAPESLRSHTAMLSSGAGDRSPNVEPNGQLELIPEGDLAQLATLSGALTECNFDLGCQPGD